MLQEDDRTRNGRILGVGISPVSVSMSMDLRSMDMLAKNEHEIKIRVLAAGLKVFKMARQTLAGVLVYCSRLYIQWFKRFIE